MPGGIIPPLEVYEAWPKPNYVDPVTEGPALVIVGLLLSSVAVLLVAARVYSRLFITRAPGIDDCLILVSLASAITMTVLVIIGNKKYGIGYHIWDVPPSAFISNRLNVYITEWFYVTATSSVKISVLLFYRRLSSSFNRVFFVATWIGIAYNVGYVVAFLTLLGNACRPLNAYWLQVDLLGGWPETHQYTCIDEHITLPTSASLSVLGDFYATLLPCILILHLDLPRRQKIALYSLFLLGFFVVGAGIVRTYSINYLINETYDNTWYLWKHWLWSFIEVYLAIIAASAPALKPFFRRFLLDPISSRRGDSYAYAGDREAASRGERAVQRKLWSNSSSTMPFGENGDVEKIGMAGGGGGGDTRKYELRTLPSGKVEPVPVHVGPPASADVRSNSQTSSFNPTEHAEWALAPTGLSDDMCPLRAYRAGIEALPAIPGQGRPAPVVGYATGSRSGTLNDRPRSQSPRGHATAIPRSSPQPAVGDGGERDWADEQARRSSQGSVRAARLRAQNSRHGAAARPAAGPVTEERDDHDHDDHDGASDKSTSDETLRLPRQGKGDRESSVYDNTSLHLPRHGVVEDTTFRASRVGLAV